MPYNYRVWKSIITHLQTFARLEKLKLEKFIILTSFSFHCYIPPLYLRFSLSMVIVFIVKNKQANKNKKQFESFCPLDRIGELRQQVQSCVTLSTAQLSSASLGKITANLAVPQQLETGESWTEWDVAAGQLSKNTSLLTWVIWLLFLMCISTT